MILTPSPAPHAPGTWPAPAGYLHGFLDARQPGYAIWKEDSSSFQIAPALYAGDDVLGQMYIDGGSGGLEWAHVNGQTRKDGAVDVTWNDRLGEVLGFAVDPGDVVAGEVYAPSPSPLYLPYQGAIIREREQRRESHRATSRHGRDVQRTWGLVTLYHVTATIPAWCAAATSWYVRGGRLAVQPVGGTRVEGSILRVALTWIGQHRAEARLELILSAEVA